MFWPQTGRAPRTLGLRPPFRALESPMLVASALEVDLKILRRRRMPYSSSRPRWPSMGIQSRYTRPQERWSLKRYEAERQGLVLYQTTTGPPFRSLWRSQWRRQGSTSVSSIPVLLESWCFGLCPSLSVAAGECFML